MVVTSLLIAITASMPAAMADDEGLEPPMYKTHLPPITEVTILESGVTYPASPEAAKECSSFKLSPQEIRDYIGKAAEVAKHDYLHVLDWSPCSTNGTVTFENGVTGTWEIQQYRAGSLSLSNGRTMYLYCPQCQAKNFPAADR
jgi:hypothetical protein